MRTVALLILRSMCACGSVSMVVSAISVSVPDGTCTLVIESNNHFSNVILELTFTKVK